MHKIKTFVRYLKDFLQYRQLRLVAASIIYLLTSKSYARTQIFRGRLGSFMHRKGTIDFQFGNYAYEWGVKVFMNKYHADYDVFIDVGANIGTYTIMLGKMGLKTYSFEPSVDNYRALQVNILLNRLENNATTFNYGLDHIDRSASFIFDPVNTGASHLSAAEFYDHVTDARGQKTEVKLMMLDHVYEQLKLNESNHILMKIDVEGMEENVLLGAKEFIKNFPNIMIVMESVHSGKEKLQSVLSAIAQFEFLEVDDLNFAAKKVGNL
jgi:FkbM family methyltransferase